jgi:cystathionine beta-lyase
VNGERLVDPNESLDSVLARMRTRTGTKWVNYGPQLLPAWVADMDFDVAPVIRAALHEAVDGDLGYPPDAPRLDLPTRLAERAATRWGWVLDPSLVELTATVMFGVRRAIDALTAPGDGIIVTTPVYPPFLKVIPEHGRRLLDCPLAPDGALDLERLSSAAASARVLLLCHPHNPTGHVLTTTELEAIAALARRHDLNIISDEIHAELTYAPHRHQPMARFAPERTVTVTSASKAFNLAGLRCAFVVAGTAALGARLAALSELDLHAAGTLGLVATRAAWSSDGDRWQAALLDQLAANRTTVIERLGPLVAVEPQSTYLTWLDTTHLGDDAVAVIRDRAGVALSDGRPFGPQGRGFVRLNFATHPVLVAELCDRIAAVALPR